MLGPFVFDSAHSLSSGHFVHASHNTTLVLLSLLMAFGSNCAALYMAHTNRRSAVASHRRVSLWCSSMVLGLGIWAMHFIGMQAMSLPVAVSYDVLGTLLSILPGMIAAWLALWSLQTTHPSNLQVASSGVWVGLGIAAMHYSGIAAMQLEAPLYFHIPQFLLSLFLGLLFAIAAFAAHRWIYQHGLENLHWSWRLLPPSLMTVAMASMHYVSMHAMRFVLPTDQAHNMPHTAGLASNQTLSLAIAAMTGVVFLILGLANALLRYRDLWQALAARDARLNAMVDTSANGVITINEQGLVQDFNPAAERMFGYTKHEVIGRNISMLMPSPLAWASPTKQFPSMAAKCWASTKMVATYRCNWPLAKHPPLLAPCLWGICKTSPSANAPMPSCALRPAFFSTCAKAWRLWMLTTTSPM